VSTALAAESRAALLELRENFAAWTEPAILARVMGAECDAALKMLDDGRYDEARGALAVIAAGTVAAGPGSMGAGVPR
jgi:hypothetical protein